MSFYDQSLRPGSAPGLQRADSSSSKASATPLVGGLSGTNGSGKGFWRQDSSASEGDAKDQFGVPPLSRPNSGGTNSDRGSRRNSFAQFNSTYKVHEKTQAQAELEKQGLKLAAKH